MQVTSCQDACGADTSDSPGGYAGYREVAYGEVVRESDQQHGNALSWSYFTYSSRAKGTSAAEVLEVGAH